MKLLSIASGSSGNSIFAGSENTNILIDAGISNKRIESGLCNAGLCGSRLDAICITHEHSDHVRGLGVISRKYGIPIYTTEKTAKAILSDLSLGSFDRDLFTIISPDKEFSVGDVNIYPFHIYHDAADPVGFRLSDGRSSVAVATDCGHYDGYITDCLRDLDAALIEANHDIRMLEAGPYPYPLKRRILSDSGHMNNENCGRLICDIYSEKLKHVFLGHLSRENNYPQLAYETVRCEILRNSDRISPESLNVLVADRDKPSVLVEV